MVYFFFIFFIFLTLLSVCLPIKFENRLFLFLIPILILIAGFRSEDSVYDYKNYIDMFNNPELSVEPSFLIISRFVRVFFSSDVIYLFVIYAFLGVILKFVAIKQLTELSLLSLVIYCSNFFMLHEMTQIRAGVASGFLLLCIKPIFDRNFIKFLFFAILGFSFHYTAILIFPLWFISSNPRKKLLFFLIPFAYFLFFLGINLITTIPIPGIEEKIEMYKQLQELGGDDSKPINVFNLYQLAKIGLYYFLLFKYDIIIQHNKYAIILMKIFCLSLMVVPIFATMQVFGFRISELYGIVEIVLFPLIFYIFKPQFFGKAVVASIGLTVFFLVVFYNKLIFF